MSTKKQIINEIKKQILDEIKKYKIIIEAPEYVSSPEDDKSDEIMYELILQSIRDEIILTRTIEQNTGKHVLIGTVEFVNSEKIEKLLQKLK